MTTHASRTAEPVLVIEDTFACSREHAFDAWTRPELLEQWFAPDGCTLRIAHLDTRPGGNFRMCVHNPSFGDCWTIGTYLEVRRPERLVFTSRIADAAGTPSTPASQGHDPEWPAETTVTVTFTERAGLTVVKLEQNVSERLARRTGAHPSWLQMLARLRHLLGTESRS